MLHLPDVLVLDIAETLDSFADLSALARTNRRLLRCLEPMLYSRPSDEFDVFYDYDNKAAPALA